MTLRWPSRRGSPGLADLGMRSWVGEGTLRVGDPMRHGHPVEGKVHHLGCLETGTGNESPGGRRAYGRG